MKQKPPFTVRDRRAVFAAGMAPAQWIREHRRELEWLGFLRRSSDWVTSFSAMLPQLGPDRSLWGDTLPALLGEWIQQAELLRKPQRKSSVKPSSASLAETKWLKDFCTAGGDEREVRGTPSRPPPSRTGQTRANPRQRQRPSASSSLTPRSAPLTDQASSSAAESPLHRGKPMRQRLQSRIAESVLRKIAGERLNTSPACSRRLDKPFEQFSDVQTTIRQRPSAPSSVLPRSAPLTDQAFSPAADKPSPSGKPKSHRAQSRIAESVLRKMTGERLNALPASSSRLDKPFERVSGVRTTIRPPPKGHPKLQQDWQNWHNGIAERVLLTMKVVGDPSWNRLLSPETLTGQWRLTLDGPQALDGHLFRSTVSESKAGRQFSHHPEPSVRDQANRTPTSAQAADKDSLGQVPETTRPNPAVFPTTRTTDYAEVKRKRGYPDVPNMEQRDQRPPLSVTPGSYRTKTQPMPAEPVLDGLIHEAASAIPGITTESPLPGHDPLPENPTAPDEQTIAPTPLNKALGAAYPSVSDTGATAIRPHPRREGPAAQPDLGDLADQIKRILDDEARRHGIDI